MEEITVTVSSMTCCAKKKPIGVSGAPYFFFTAEHAPSFTYGGCQIQVASGYEDLVSGTPDMWDSGTVRGEMRPIAYSGKPLVSFTRYYWRIRVFGNGSEVSEYSSVGEFVTGAVRRNDWTAATFASPAGGVSGIRRRFIADDTLESAYLFVGSCGGVTNACTVTLNGTRIDGDDVFPGAAEPFSMYVRGIDVTETIRRKNSLVIDFTGRVSAILKMRYSGGRTEILTGSDGWELLPDGPYALRFSRAAGRCVGEEFDRTKAGAERYSPDSQEQALPKPPSGPSPMFLRPRTYTASAGAGVPAVTVRPSGRGWLFDFGKTVVGYAGIVMRDQTSPVTVSYFEKIDQATDIPVDGGEPVCCVYRPSGAALERYSPAFLHTAFRYILVEGLSTGPELTDAVAVPITSAPKKAEFRCSDAALNALFGYVTGTFSENTINLPAGTSRGSGAAEPAFTLAAEQQLLLNDTEEIYRRFIEGLADSQPVTGFIPSEFPSAYAETDLSASVAAIAAVWALYTYTGDRSIIEKHYTSAESFMALLGTTASENFTFEDSLLPYGDRYAEEPVGREFLGAALYFRAAEIMSLWCAALRDRDGAERYRSLYNRIGNAINEKHLHFTAGRYYYESGVQSANALALWFGFCPEKAKESVTEALVADIRLKGRLTCGYIAGTGVYETLAENGHADEAYRLITERSGGRERERSAAAAGGYARWLTRTFVGLSFEKPGGKRMRIKPYLREGIDEASFSTETVYGNVSVYWQRDGGRISLDIDIPDDCEAVLCLPINNSRIGDRGRGEQFVFRSGRHHITTSDRRTDSI